MTGPPAIDQAIELSQRSLALDPDNAIGAIQLSVAYAGLGRLDEAEAVVARAHAANPNNAGLMHRFGIIYTFQGRYQEGVDFLQRALKIDPFARVHAHLARGYLLMRNYDRAEEAIQACVAQAAQLRLCFEAAAVVYSETGQIDRAREAVAAMLRVDPTFTLAAPRSRLPFKNKADQDRFHDAFRKAGVPE